MKYYKYALIFFSIVGCRSIPNTNFNFHNTNYISDDVNYQEDSVISRNYDNKLSIVGTYNPLTEEERFKVAIHIQKKGLNLNPNTKDILINRRKFDYEKYDATITANSMFNKSNFIIYPINSRELLIKIHDTSQGNTITVNFKDNFQLEHTLKIEKVYIEEFLKDFDIEKEISKNFFEKRIEKRKKELEKTKFREEYDEFNRYHIYSMEIPHFFEKPNNTSEDYTVFIISNYYPDENISILFLNITLHSNQSYLLNSIYDNDNKKLKIHNPEITKTKYNEIKETFNIMLNPQEILNMSRDIEKNYILKLKAYGEKRDFIFEIYKPLLLTFLKEINNSIRSLQTKNKSTA
ncbi:hypothetical protein CR532_05140 (plasmid) [Candidatus Borreliella tachyglossi]|uniref:Lipoprotein n=1 Tax=Candidatus Borreliella tachyglossi TaxID=1964448 RepID=A0A2S1LYN6_9SPIR|nr:hypothetical protein [Candidatus Borreliella tachyglossi]AWG43380.1 hypothetical protein CR532_05140 [Candidatus Borreliella tachyglossi]